MWHFIKLFYNFSKRILFPGHDYVCPLVLHLVALVWRTEYGVATFVMVFLVTFHLHLVRPDDALDFVGLTKGLRHIRPELEGSPARTVILAFVLARVRPECVADRSRERGVERTFQFAEFIECAILPNSTVNDQGV